MAAICIIPARGGSKRLPRKNALKLNGKPLISYTIEAAINSGLFKQIIVTSDDLEILSIARGYEIETDRRPSDLSSDTATQAEVVLDLLKRRKLPKEITVVCSLLPTCPFRSAIDIQKAFQLFKESSEKFLVSVKKFEFPIQLAFQENSMDSTLLHACAEINNQLTRSQEYEDSFHPNGAIYIADINKFIENRSFINRDIIGYRMSEIKSFDIDYEWQFKLAELIIKNNLHEQ